MKLIQPLLILMLLGVLLIACRQDEGSPVSAVTALSPTSAPLEEPTAMPSATASLPEPAESTAAAAPASSTPAIAASTATPSPAPSASPTSAVALNGRTPEGAYYLGRSDAPVTIIDYSDFL